MKISLVFLASAMWAMIFFGLALAISFRWPELVDPRKSPVFALGAGSALLLLFLLWFYYFKTIRCYMIVERIVLFLGRKFFVLRANLSLLHSRIRGSEEWNMSMLWFSSIFLALIISEKESFYDASLWLRIPIIIIVSACPPLFLWSIKNLSDNLTIKKERKKYKHGSAAPPKKKYPTS